MAKKTDESAQEKRECLQKMLEGLSNYQILRGGYFPFTFEGDAYYYYVGQGNPPDPPPPPPPGGDQ
jgi:hypothetical protein